jgi:hypothetical protein
MENDPPSGNIEPPPPVEIKGEPPTVEIKINFVVDPRSGNM